MSGSSAASSSVGSPTGLSAAQLRKEIATLAQAENSAKSAQQKASDAASLQQYQAQLARVQAKSTTSSATEEAPRAPSNDPRGKLVDTAA